MIQGRTGLFLGAGASYELGMPLVWELTKEIKAWLTPASLREFNGGWREQRSGYPDEVIDDLATVLERDDCHYEAMLGHLETQFLRRGPHSTKYHGLYSWLVELVSVLLTVHHTKNLELIKRLLPRYEGIKSLLATNTPLWVFSLNHGLMIEALAAHFSIPLHSGFVDAWVKLPRRDQTGRKIGEIYAEVLPKTDHEHGSMHFPDPPQQGIYLLKIHGALDVFTFNDGHDLVKLVPGASTVDDIIEVLRAANEDLVYADPSFLGGKARTINEITYADDTGEMQFLRRSLLAGAYKFDTRQLQVLPMGMLNAFRVNLNFVTKLVCIGYGFGDHHINLVMREWLEFSRDRCIEIVNPGISHVPAFLQHLGPQVNLVSSDTTSYLDREAGIIRTPQEALEKRMMIASRKLGKERSEAIIRDLQKREKERSIKEFVARLAELPIVDGKPDLSGEGTPERLAVKWASELKLSPEEGLKKLVDEMEDAAGIQRTLA
jgi:hypothetical protein